MRALLRHPAGKLGLALLLANEVRGVCVVLAVMPQAIALCKHMLGAV